MGKQINVAVITIICYSKNNKAAGLAASGPVAHGGDPLWPRWQVFRSDRKTKKSFGLGGRCYLSAAPLQEAAESPYHSC